MKRNRVIAIVLALSLCFGLFVHSTFAFTYPSGLYDYVSVFNEGYYFQTVDVAGHIANFESSFVASDSNGMIVNYISGNDACLYFSCEHGDISIRAGEIFISSSSTLCHYGTFYSYSDSAKNSSTSSSISSFSIDDVAYYGTGVSVSQWMIDSCSFYCSSDLYLGSELFSPPNLDVSSLMPDDRVLRCTKEYKYPFSSNPLEYIHISLDDNPVGSFLALTFEDYNGDIRTSTIYPESYINVHDIEGTGIYWSFDVPPYLLSSYEFTLSQVTYWSGGDWGTKTIDVDLSFYEGERYPLTTNWNNIYYVTEFVESQDNGSIVYGSTTLYLSYQYEGEFYYYDFEWSSCQPFTIKVLFMPDFMNNPLGSNNIDWLYQIYEQYDLIFTGLNQSTFDYIFSEYNTFTYNSLNGLWQISEEDAIESLTKREPKYINSNKSVKNYLTAQYFQSDVGVIYTRSFLLKRMCSSLGDLDDRLLEFEFGLIGEDGALVSVQTKLNNIYKGQNDFFNGINDFVLKWDYWLDNYDVSDKLDSIVSRLDSILTFLEGDLSINLDGLEHPWIDFYNFIKRAFDGAQRYLGNFTSSASAILDGSDMTRLPVPSISVEPALPFNPTLTPIPIPSFIPVPTLSGGG